MRYSKLKRSAFRPINTAWSRLPVRYRGGVVVAIPAACLIITLGCWVWSREAQSAIRREIEAIQRNIASSNEVLIQNLNAETGVRGYVVTRDRGFLEPYKQAQTVLIPELERLQQKVINQPESRQQIQGIQTLSQENIRNLQKIVDAVATQSLQFDRADLTRSLNTNKRAMDALRAAIGTFQQEEQQLLAANLKRRERVQEATSAALWFTAIISALGSWAAIYLFTQVDRDLTDREQRLTESRSLLNAIVLSVVDGVIMLDKFGKIDSFNPTASVLFGYQPEEVFGKDLNLLLAESNPQATETDLENVVQTGRTWQTTGLRQDGSTFPIAVSVSDVQLDDHRLIAIVRDMTEVEQTQAKLQSRANELAKLSAVLAQTNITLEDRNRELEQFAYVASHDLKAPLRAIANLSEWIEEDLQGTLPPENQKQMQLLRGRVHRMEALINGLLEYSRVGRTNAPIELVSVPQLLHEIIDSLAPDSIFTIEVDSDLPTFKTKKLALRQVFANLVSNAIKHHHDSGGTVQISSKDADQFYEFSVIDNGPGIHPDYHQKIFTIFQTLKARDVKESTGIGLAIVKKIVETEGGTIHVDSHEGRGATFRFTWRKEVSLT